MKEIKCDVLVVGAGPIGCTMASIIAKKNIDVVAIDRKFQVASPLRGGEAVCKPFYDELMEKLPILKKVPKKETEGTSLEAGNCKLISREEKWKAYVLERKIFEKTLAEEAIKSGANLMLASELIKVNQKKGNVTEAIVRTMRGKYQIKPRIIVAADGFASFFRKLLNFDVPNKDWASAIEFEMANIKFREPDLLEVFFMEAIPGGYSYIFPKFGTRGLTGVAMRPQFNGGKSALHIFNQIVTNYPAMSSQLKDAHILETRGGCIDVSGPFEEPVSSNILFV
ncbi:MAG TPA: NAD(P)/FAD-dependent oxidoreductase, partial [Candidatus Atribacteria bacterium]|nr:NAD(P)/FAD-dependent oxidoreductase [Candidatus Atribacteria bacterium]